MRVRLAIGALPAAPRAVAPADPLSVRDRAAAREAAQGAAQEAHAIAPHPGQHPVRGGLDVGPVPGQLVPGGPAQTGRAEAAVAGARAADDAVAGIGGHQALFEAAGHGVVTLGVTGGGEQTFPAREAAPVRHPAPAGSAAPRASGSFAASLVARWVSISASNSAVSCARVDDAGSLISGERVGFSARA